GEVLKDRPLYEAQIRFTIGCFYRNGGRSKDAITQFTRAAELQKQQRGPNHPVTLTTVSVLAESLASLGKTTDATTLFEQLRDAQVMELGPHHPITLVTLNNLACVYLYAGKRADALKLWESI